MIVTRQQILTIMPKAASVVDKFLSVINANSERFGFTTPYRMAYFLANVAHECGELRWMKEFSSGAQYDTGKLAAALGNTQAKDGDGQKYKGRGCFMLTGRANYKAYNDYLRAVEHQVVDLLAHPELLEQPKGAMKSAMWFAHVKNLHRYADAKQFRAYVKALNGGYNGIDQRNVYLARAERAFNLV